MSFDVLTEIFEHLTDEPGITANEIDRRVRSVPGRAWRNDVLEAVRLARTLPGVSQGVRGPGRPRKMVRGPRSGIEGAEQ
jgi:hypothetical protein